MFPRARSLGNSDGFGHGRRDRRGSFRGNGRPCSPGFAASAGLAALLALPHLPVSLQKIVTAVLGLAYQRDERQNGQPA